MKYISFLILLFSQLSFAQVEFEKWEAKTQNYVLVSSFNEKNYNSSSMLSILQMVYSILISEPDGDNCPFSPSCSNFFIEAVEKSNFFTGTLLFADRFTRDMNLFKDLNQYPKLKNKKLYDPVDRYLSSK